MAKDRVRPKALPDVFLLLVPIERLIRPSVLEYPAITFNDRHSLAFEALEAPTVVRLHL